LLIFDEVKTGFRHALGGYQAISGVTPDLCTFGKAVANGYPMGVVGGKKSVMELCSNPDPSKRVVIAGTYNGHPVNVAATKACLTRLKTREAEVYGELERLGAKLEAGLNEVFAKRNYATTLVRQGSAFTVYFMDHVPKNWRDVAMNNDHEHDVAGGLPFPAAAKQSSISLAHTDADLEQTISLTDEVLNKLG
jgi:glutamate-1-semialdehyde 2,1-aminomutase